MAEIVEYLAADVLQIGVVTATDKKKITVDDGRGRQSKIAPDKVVFRHRGDSIDEVRASIEALRGSKRCARRRKCSFSAHSA